MYTPEDRPAGASESLTPSRYHSISLTVFPAGATATGTPSWTAMAAYPAFQCEVQVPAGDVGVSRTATVTYFNDGISAIAAPYVRFEAGNNAYVRFSESDAWSKSVEFLATSDQSPASSLRAGETVEIPVFVYTASQEAQLTLSYTQSSTETAAIDQQEENQ